MTTKSREELIADCGAWWDTGIIDVHPVMGPMPKAIPYRYSGPARRPVPPAADAPTARGND